ncbi:MAG: NAD(P)/FAD-dependent oxidoreductase [Candidatus Omnitrophica bacterium]|nr:NAD(P)/FAD-dependent oxidoreductase [Candidatus Omnitrophota bacterium]
MEYDCIVIGAGVGGLIAGLKLSQENKKILLLEAQPVPGGFATTFKRNGFIFESALHCVDALGPDGEIREFLKEHNIDKTLDFSELNDFARIIYPGHDFVVNFKEEDLIDYFKKTFPDESKNIDRLFHAMGRFFEQFDRYRESNLPSWLEFIFLIFFSPSLIGISMLTAQQFIEKYTKDKKLIAIFTDIWRFIGLPPSRLSALYFLIVLRGYYCEPTAYIKGGFSELFAAIVSKIRENGSEVRFNARVDKIITHKGKRVKSVITAKGEEFYTKAIISNANAIDSLTNLVDNDKIKADYLRKLAALEKSISAFQVYLGLKVPAKSLGMSHQILSINTTYNHDENYNYCFSQDYDNCSLEIVDHSQIDSSLVPQGKGSLLIMIFDLYAHWKDLTQEEYKLRKQEVADKLIERAEKYLPGLSKNIEVIEAATPLTMQRFGLSPEGAIYGFTQTVKQSGTNRLSQKTAVGGLFLTGAWTRPGHGVHGCFVSGMEAADLALGYLKKAAAYRVK